ncbi:MAG: DUF1579 domain-containing protein [Planctomycetaceae bacterium]|nr:DUF1579 domain-containing protein [Planctomycetaceae bacterium]
MFRPILLSACAIAALGLAIAASATLTAADDPKPAANNAAQQEPKLPPGWTKEDLAAFIAAATPGTMHARLKEDVGVWNGKNTMWMAPGAPPVESESTTTVTALLDGRFTRGEIKGEVPGMGPYNGLMLAGYDNITQKFVSTWVDNMSTSIASGEGELSKDGKTLTWTFTCNCPLTKKPVAMRQIETVTGPGTKTIEMFGAEPKSGKEYKMMHIELTKAK